MEHFSGYRGIGDADVVTKFPLWESHFGKMSRWGKAIKLKLGTVNSSLVCNHQRTQMLQAVSRDIRKLK
jgi:hypothetical protein